MNEILHHFNEVPGATTHPMEFASKGATNDDAPLPSSLPLPLADVDGVPASGARAGERTGPAAVAFLPAMSTTTASSSLAPALDVTTATSTTSPVITTLQPPTIAAAMSSTSMPSTFSTSAMVNDAAPRTGTSLVTGVPTMCSTSVLDGHYATVVSLLSSTPSRDAPSMTLPATVIASSEPTTPCRDTQKLLDGIPCHQEIAAVHVLHVTVSHMLYDVSVEVLHQVFGQFGARKVCMLEESPCVEAMVTFTSHQDAVRAQEACNGRCIWDGCCVMDISQAQQAVIPTIFAVHKTSTMESIVPTIAVSRTTAGGSLCDKLITCVRAEDDSNIDADPGMVTCLLAEDRSEEVVSGEHLQACPQTPKFPCALDGELQKCVEEIESESGHMLMGSGKLLELNGNCKEAADGMFSYTSGKKKDGLFLGIGEFLSYGAEVWQPWPPPNPLQIPRIISSDRVFDRGKYIQFLSWPICIDSNSTSTPLSSVSVQRAISERTRLLWMRGECVATLTEMRKLSQHQALKFSDMLMLLIVRKWGPDTPYIYMGNIVFQVGADFDVVPTRANVRILFHGDQIDIQSRQPWLTPMHNDMQNANVQLMPKPWLSFWSYAVGMLVRKQLSLPRLSLCYSLREIKFKDPWPLPDWACSSANILSWNSDTWRAHLIFGSVPKTRNSLHSPSAKVSCCLLVIHMLVPWKCLIAAEIICERAQFSEISMLKLFSMVLTATRRDFALLTLCTADGYYDLDGQLHMFLPLGCISDHHDN